MRPHDLRHAHATFALRQGESVLAIARLLGHASPQTTLKYTHLADAIVREAVEFDAYSRTASGGANRTLDILCQILEFAIACGHLDINPARAVTMNRRAALTRFLSRDELRRLHLALDRHARTDTRCVRQADIIRLLLPGCRRGEILTLRWNEVDGDTIALADAKTGPRKVVLNAGARRIIERRP